MGNETLYNFIENVMPDGVKFVDLPEIKHQISFVGSTDYIDSIYPEHLSHRVMRGKDHFNRLYIVVYYKGNIQTYFQRYTGQLSGIWSYGKYVWGNLADCVLQGCGNIAAQPDSMAKIKEVITELLDNNKLHPVKIRKIRKY